MRDVMTNVTGPARVDQDRKAPGRPRSARADGAIVDAVLDLLSEGTTAEALSIEAVATRAGVGKATIYRRWPNKEALLVDAVASIKGGLPHVRGESVREDLLMMLRQVGRVDSTRASRITPGILAQLHHNSELQRCYQKMLEPRRELMRGVLRRGIERGELRPDIDVDVVMTMLVAPLVAQTLLHWNPNLEPSAMPERLVDAIWPAIAAP